MRDDDKNLQIIISQLLENALDALDAYTKDLKNYSGELLCAKEQNKKSFGDSWKRRRMIRTGINDDFIKNLRTTSSVFRNLPSLCMALLMFEDRKNDGDYMHNLLVLLDEFSKYDDAYFSGERKRLVFRADDIYCTARFKMAPFSKECGWLKRILQDQKESGNEVL